MTPIDWKQVEADFNPQFVQGQGRQSLVRPIDWKLMNLKLFFGKLLKSRQSLVKPIDWKQESAFEFLASPDNVANPW